MSRRTVTAVAAVAALLALAGSASQAAAQESTQEAARETGAGPVGPGPAASGDRLSITVADTGDPAQDGSYTLRCHPAGGDHPAAWRACAALDRATESGSGDPFKPVAQRTNCTMIHGGSATAHISGSWRGKNVDARFERNNGCEIDRWEKLVPALPQIS